MKNFGIQKDSSLDFLNGEVAKVEFFTFDVKENIAKKTEHSYREYDKNGNRILSVYYDDEKIYLRQVTLFNESGKKIGFTNYDEDGNKSSFVKYQLDINGRMIAKYYNDECEEEYEYDNKGNIIQVYYPNIMGGKTKNIEE